MYKRSLILAGVLSSWMKVSFEIAEWMDAVRDWMEAVRDGLVESRGVAACMMSDQNHAQGESIPDEQWWMTTQRQS